MAQPTYFASKDSASYVQEAKLAPTNGVTPIGVWCQRCSNRRYGCRRRSIGRSERHAHWLGLHLQTAKRRLDQHCEVDPRRNRALRRIWLICCCDNRPSPLSARRKRLALRHNREVPGSINSTTTHGDRKPSCTLRLPLDKTSLAGLLRSAEASLGQARPIADSRPQMLALHMYLTRQAPTVLSPWWNGASLASIPTVSDTVVFSNTVYRFVEWRLDGVRLTDINGAAINPPLSILMNAPHQATAIYLPENEDIDGNTLPDWWECRYFGSHSQDPNADPDLDGMPNWKEWKAGTSPVDASDVLKLTAKAVKESQNSALLLQWTGSTGKKYSIYGASYLTGEYAPIATNIAATSPSTQISIPISTNIMFYRLMVEP